MLDEYISKTEQSIQPLLSQLMAQLPRKVPECKTMAEVLQLACDTIKNLKPTVRDHACQV